MSDVILEARNLAVRFRNRPAVDDVTVAFRRGEAVVIAGPNGAGKSTFLRALAGAVVPDRGQVVFGPGFVRESLGFLSDRLSLYERGTLEEAWAFHRREFKIAEPRRPLLPGFDPDAGRKIKDLSVGERTLFHLSLLLAQKPAVLLVDEVLHALDPYLREKFIEAVIEAMAAHQTAVVMVNHAFIETAQLPERIMIMDRGRFILDEKRDDLERRVKKVVSEGAWPSDIPILFETESELRQERYVYPFREEWRGTRGLDFKDIGLGEIIKAFVGGAYVQKRTR
ncbi:MAG: ABC transporter ATP-binding protein [Candidatus Aminicenantes bacterium]|nr:ABC transporter ATP-binding protein [Candidatus Aminicenantes bacterium]